jgi:hypothetical protein
MLISLKRGARRPALVNNALTVGGGHDFPDVSCGEASAPAALGAARETPRPTVLAIVSPCGADVAAAAAPESSGKLGSALATLRPVGAMAMTNLKIPVLRSPLDAHRTARLK